MNKKIAIIISIGLFAQGLLFGQSTRPRRVDLSIFAGPTISWASSRTEGFKSGGAAVGGVYGINTDINLVQTAENYYFHLGINARHIRSKLNYTDNYILEDKAAKTTEYISKASIASTYNMIYLSIPTAIKLRTNPFGNFVIFGVVGLEHGICLSSRANDKITYTQNEKDEVVARKDKVDMYSKTSFFRESLYISFGAEYIIRDNTRAFVAIAFDNGFNNIFRGKKYINEVYDEKVNAKSHSFEFQFGFFF